jgi:hypothetical protein
MNKHPYQDHPKQILDKHYQKQQNDFSFKLLQEFMPIDHVMDHIQLGYEHTCGEE